MSRNTLTCGLYAITDEQLTAPAQLEHAVSEAIAGGAAVIQYRNKRGTARQRQQQAAALVQLCQPQNVPLIINDDVALAASVNADGVHLGKMDSSLAEARQQLGPQAIIGVSCYNSLEGALSAAEAGADYVAFGRFFSSHSKPDAQPAETPLLRQARQQLQLPIVAIGGITPANGQALLAAGADLLAAIHGVFGQSDIQAAASAYATLFPDH
jgi:thiamine-phosphate pyrophosphorylase